ncbi:MAG: S1C family serine protease, partial [Clostridiales bacterium]|nr:S1C family serine protease [Clostridiales bacterium]
MGTDYDYIVKVLNKDKKLIGTGLLLNGYVLTADHIFDDFDKAYITYKDKTYEASFDYYGRDEKDDIVFLKVDIHTGYKPDYILIPEKLTDEIRNKTLNIKGHPTGISFLENDNTTANLINSKRYVNPYGDADYGYYNYKGYKCSIESPKKIHKGYSGSSVFYDDSCILGMVVSGTIKEPQNSEIIPTTEIVKTKDGYYKHLFGKENTPGKTESNPGKTENKHQIPLVTNKPADKPTDNFVGREGLIKDIKDMI